MPGRRWTARVATPTEFEALSSLHGACFARRWSAAELRQLTADTTATALAAIRDDDIAGFVIPRVAASEAEILTIAVAPAYRRAGAGAFLLNEAIQWSAQNGASEIFLEVAEDNAAAMALYFRAGFKLAGRRPGYFQSLSDDADTSNSALVMRLEIGK